MTKVILTTADELEQIVQSSVRRVLMEQKPQVNAQDQWINIEQAAQYLGFAVQTIYQKVSERVIPFHKKGKKLWFLQSELDAWVREGRHKTRKEIEQEVKSGTISLSELGTGR